MNKKYIEKIQKKILELLPEEKHQKKALLLEDSCSELTRLIASWINENDEFSHQTIIKSQSYGRKVPAKTCQARRDFATKLKIIYILSPYR